MNALQYKNRRKHSYSELDKRNFAKRILFYLQDPEDAKTIFDPKWKNFASKKMEEGHRKAYKAAQELIDNTKQGKPVNVTRYSPVIEAIKKELIKYSTRQIELF